MNYLICGSRLALVSLLLVAAACESGGRKDGAQVNVMVPQSWSQAVAAARADVASDRPADAAGFASRWSTKYATGLPYDPLQAQGLDRITASRLGVSDAERQALARDGFVISARQTFPTFFYGYKAIYADHLPLYVSVDSVMHAVHRSYDAALMTIELNALIPTLKVLLAAMRDALAAGVGSNLPLETRADVDLYLAVASQLLGGPGTPVAGAKVEDISNLVASAMAASGIGTATLFGEKRDIDFSQFKPRGHYERDATLSAYFRSMIWLGRTDLRFLQFNPFAPAGTPPTFFRRQFLAGLLLGELESGQTTQVGLWRSIDDVLRAFVGESDNMTVSDFPRLLDTAGAASWDELAALPDAAIAQALLDGNFGIQRIASQVLLVPSGGAGVPLDRVFLFFGQRFVIDSQVFSDTVFDRVRGEPKRMMPNPLDVAFAALGNNAAAPLLATDLATYPNYPGALHDVRRLVDLHGEDFWGGNLYTTWLGALRGLSIAGGDPTSAAGLPALMKTEPWARRIVNTQLGSWAELRHDTLLYAKQSYTAVPVCDFPDAYVDPYPEAWAGIARMAQLGQTIATIVPGAIAGLSSYFVEVESVATTLGGMAQAERAGQPLSSDQMAFINQAVDETTTSGGCVPTVTPTGWYVRLFMNPSDAQKTDPTIADVHTDPADGQVLHVATGLPRLMYVTVDGCNGPRAYAGLVSSYFEVTTANLQRLTDSEWSSQIMSTPPADVPWIAGLVVR